MFDGSTLAVTGLAFLLAGVVKGVIGMGLPTVAIAVLTLTMPPALAAALYVLPAIVTNAWQGVAGPNLLGLLRRLGTMFAGVIAGIWFGAGVLTGDTSGHAAIALGIALASYAAFGLMSFELRVPRPWEVWLSPLIGLATGLVTGATGIFIVPAVPYIQALQMEREELIQSLGLSFLIATVTLALVLARAGILGSEVAVVSMVAVVPAVIGMYVGQIFRTSASPKTFRTCFFLGMLGLGLNLASRAFR
jgi:uncharacterized protein